MPLGPLRDGVYIGNQGGGWGGLRVPVEANWRSWHTPHLREGDAFSHLEVIPGIAFKVS